jgi:hypothetical protein
MWRCVNDIFGYCASEPKDPTKRTKYPSIDADGSTALYELTLKTCQASPKHCEFYQTSGQVMPVGCQSLEE